MTATLAIDPVIQIALRTALALLFAWAAFHKLRDMDSFRAVLASYALLPASTTAAAAAVVIGAELSIAFALLLVPRSGPALGAAVLLVIYTIAIAINLARGRSIDCGCSGPTLRPLSGDLIARNGVLIVVAMISFLPASSRPLVWVDAITVIGAVAFLSLLYAAIEAILLNAPDLALLRVATIDNPVVSFGLRSDRFRADASRRPGAHPPFETAAKDAASSGRTVIENRVESNDLAGEAVQ